MAKIEVRTLELKEMFGKTFKEVAAYLKQENINVAGRVEMEDMLANPDKYPELKDDNWYYFFGAADDDVVPCVVRYGVRFGSGRNWSGRRWISGDRVVVMNTEVETKTEMPTDSLNLENRVKKLEEFEQRVRAFLIIE